MPAHAMIARSECPGCPECAGWRANASHVVLPPVPSVARCACGRLAHPDTGRCLRCTHIAAYQAPPVPYYPEVRGY